MKNNLASLILLIFSIPGYSQNSAERVKNFNLQDHLAIQGYDPVAYFTVSKAIKGKKEISTSFDNVTYYFSSESNKKTFLKNPKSYEPEYGGWCAFAMGDYGKKVAINPETFKIIDGKLYLFYNTFLNNTLKSWNKDETNLLQKAELN